MSKLKFSVGYPCTAPQSFFATVSPYLDRIGEVYFAWDRWSTGRAVSQNDTEQTERELTRFREQGVRLNLLLNGNCYGGEAMSPTLAQRVCDTVGYLKERVGLHAVTTTSPFIAHTVKQRFPDIEVRASVNMWVDGIAGMQQCADIFDSFYVNRDSNYDIAAIRRQHAWCRENGKSLYLLANSGCIPQCAYHIFHDNMVSHSEEVLGQPTDPLFKPYACRRMLAKPENRYLLLAGNLVRPEDIHHYEDAVDGIKLATRIHPFPAVILRAYCRERWEDDLCALTEPGYGDMLSPYMLDNAAIPAEYWEQKTTCAHTATRDGIAACADCGYCAALYQNIRKKQAF